MAWRSSLGFRDRLDAITEISSSYESAYPVRTSAEVSQQARALENGAYNNARSRSEYDKLRQSIIEDLRARISTIKPNPNNGQTNESSDGGITVGNYQHAMYHRRGLFSQIFKAVAPGESHSSSSIVALKITVPSAMSPPHDSEREARILRQAQSSNVITLIDTFRQAGGQFILVFPFMAYDLERLMKEQRLPENDVRACLRDLFTALAHLHSLGIIHRDVKPSNILLKSPSGPAYLADFGIAWKEGEATSEPADAKITDVGTTSYRAPELLFGNKAYNCSLDLWAAGCVVAEITNGSGKTLFDSGDLGSELALIQSIFKSLGTPNLEVWPEAVQFPDWGKMDFHQYPPRPWSELLPKASEDARNLVNELVRYQSTERLVASKALKHSYFKD